MGVTDVTVSVARHSSLDMGTIEAMSIPGSWPSPLISEDRELGGLSKKQLTGL